MQEGTGVYMRLPKLFAALTFIGLMICFSFCCTSYPPNRTRPYIIEDNGQRLLLNLRFVIEYESISSIQVPAHNSNYNIGEPGNTEMETIPLSTMARSLIPILSEDLYYLNQVYAQANIGFKFSFKQTFYVDKDEKKVFMEYKYDAESPDNAPFISVYFLFNRQTFYNIAGIATPPNGLEIIDDVIMEEGIFLFYPNDQEINSAHHLLAHEMGHYLGLWHTWEDDIGDTPPISLEEGEDYGDLRNKIGDPLADPCWNNIMSYSKAEQQILTPEQIKKIRRHILDRKSRAHQKVWDTPTTPVSNLGEDPQTFKEDVSKFPSNQNHGAEFLGNFPQTPYEEKP